MKLTKKYLIWSKFKTQGTNNNFNNNVLSAQKIKLLRCNQILTILTFIPDKRQQYHSILFRYKHTFSKHGKIIIKKPEVSGKQKLCYFDFFGSSFRQLYTAITVCLARSELSISST